MNSELDQHESNKMRLQILESDMDPSSHSHHYTKDVSVSPDPISPLASPPSSAKGSSSSLASALFHRKPKKKSSSSNSKSKTVKAQIEEIRADEIKLQKHHHHLQNRADDAALEEDENEVVDLADQLLLQLEVNESSQSPSPASSANALPVPSSKSKTASPIASDSPKKTGGFFHHHANKSKSRQQARLQRRDDAMAQATAEARKELESSGQDPAEAERQEIVKICRELNVDMIEMNPDGHCLFASIADQVTHARLVKQPADYHSVRHAVSTYMAGHADDFIPFLTPDEGREGKPSHDGMMSSEEYQEYCQSIRDTAEWGGQLEIVAMTHIYQVPIHIYQAFSPASKLGDEYSKQPPLKISYHHHMYGLGEHYNSLRRQVQPIQMRQPSFNFLPI